MAPRLALKKNSVSKIITKKHNRSLKIIAKLRKEVALLSKQNKELSMFRNDILLKKLELEKEYNSVRNSNLQLKGMYQVVCTKLRLVEQNLKECVPALVTMSSCIPNMIQSVHEMCNIEKFNEFSQKGKKEKQTKSVSPMINGFTIVQPAVTLKRLDMSTIVESPSPEQTPKRRLPSNTRKSSPRASLEPYVRLNDVKIMLNNSKTIPSESTFCQLEDNIGEGPSSLYSQDNQTHDSDNNNSATDHFGNCSSVLTVETMPNNSFLAVSSSTSSINNTLGESNIRNSELMYADESTVLRNVTSRKQTKRGSSKLSVASDINSSTNSVRSRRSAAINVNYKEPKLGTKLRRS